MTTNTDNPEQTELKPPDRIWIIEDERIGEGSKIGPAGSYYVRIPVDGIEYRRVSASPAAPVVEKCEHGILWSMECLSCGHSDYVAAASTASTQEDAEHVSEL